MIAWIVLTLAALAFSLALLPRILIARAQDRRARQMMERESWKLLTRADRVVTRYRRLPGLLGLSDGRIAFEGLFGETTDIATLRVRKIITGRRSANGRTFLRLEVLRLTLSNGEELEFVLSPASASAWRSHLGLWAAGERHGEADRVTPGRR